MAISKIRHLFPVVRTSTGCLGATPEIQIASESGVDVRSLSQYGAEEEVLFSPGTKFKVTNRVIDPNNRHHVIVLKEIK